MVFLFLLLFCNLIIGGIFCVLKCLDVCYDWLLLLSMVFVKYGYLLVVFVGDVCNESMFINVNEDYLVFVLMEGVECLYFIKVSSFFIIV